MTKLNLFKAQISENQNSFDKKIELIDFFSLHKEISERAFELMNDSGKNDLMLLSDEYRRVSRELKTRNKTYEQLHNEKVFVDIYSSFEKLLYDHLHTIYSFFPKISFPVDRISVRFSDIFLSDDLESSREYVIQDTIKGIIQSNTIDKTIEIMLEKINIKKNDQNILTNDDRKNLLKYSKIRNLIIHNEALMNKIVAEELKKIEVNHSFLENQSVSEDLDEDISNLKLLLSRISHKITDTLLDKSLTVYNYDKSK